MTQSLNPLLRPENRKKFIEQAMKEMSEQQDAVIKRADSMIENVAQFEENVRKQFALYSAH